MYLMYVISCVIVIFVNYVGLMDVWILKLLNIFFYKNYYGVYYMCIIFVFEKIKIKVVYFGFYCLVFCIVV